MILKASQRGGGKQLGLHLMRSDDNEHVEVHQIRGFISDSVVEAFKEAHAVSKGTRCKQFLFSVSLNPPPQEIVPVETFEAAIARIEEKTGLTGHPRVVVFHEKEGRRHAHAVWSRIDAETMTTKNLSHFKLKMRDLSRELYLENGWKMPRGLTNSREADPRNFTLEEWQQSKRVGRDARDWKELMQDCWAISDSKAAFMQALKARGFTLAQGDRRGHVAISPEGEVISISRYTGKKTKEIEARLGKPDTLPSVESAKAQLAKDLSATFKRHLRDADEQKRQALEPLEAKRNALVQQQRQERSDLKAKQQERWTSESQSRTARFPQGAKGLWSRISGAYAATQKQNEREAYSALARDSAQRQNLIDSQMMDRQALQGQIVAARAQHAATLRALRADQQAVRQIGQSALGKQEPARTSEAPSFERRVHRLREGQKPPRARDRDWDRER